MANFGVRMADPAYKKSQKIAENSKFAPHKMRDIQRTCACTQNTGNSAYIMKTEFSDKWPFKNRSASSSRKVSLH